MIPVIATQDESGHWYVIPKDQYKGFSEITNNLCECNFEDYDLIEQFESKFARYRTGGDLNNIQLYAILD